MPFETNIKIQPFKKCQELEGSNIDKTGWLIDYGHGERG